MSNAEDMDKDTQRRSLFAKLARLYADMQEAYDRVASQIGLSCEGCADNCCASYFQHHTYIEWAYLWEGMNALARQKQQAFLDRAEEYVRESHILVAQELRPRLMCPLNDNGLCRLYPYRLMICRLHGVPNSLVLPDGKRMDFPGCFRCQALCSRLQEVSVLDRTGLYRDLASLELAFVGSKMKDLPRVRLTLAEMLVQGPPPI